MSVPVMHLPEIVGDNHILKKSEDSDEESDIYCSCQSEYCDCGCKLGVTEASARNIYKHLGFPAGRDALFKAHTRASVLHIWGTHNLSTEDLLSWLSDYNPVNLEWVNDASCNVVLPDETTALRVILDFAEPFDRRVALAAAASLVALIESRQEQSETPTGDSESADVDSCSPIVSSEWPIDNLEAVNEFSQYLPPSGRWYKALSVPSKVISLFLRFASVDDLKLPGAERRSVYYRRFGNPNYGGINGILSSSYRRRLRVPHLQNTNDKAISSGSLRHVRIIPSELAEVVAHTYVDPDSESPSVSHQISSSMAPFRFRGNRATTGVSRPPQRELLVYDDNPHTDSVKAASRKVRTGSRREAVDFPTPKAPYQPHKWPRRDRGPPPLRWADNSPPRQTTNIFNSERTTAVNREPWDENRVSRRPRDARNSIREARQKRYAQALMTITLLPEDDDNNGDIVENGYFQHETSSMARNGLDRAVDEEDTAFQTRRLLASMSMVADAEEQTRGSEPNRSLSHRVGLPNSHRKQELVSTDRSVWQRLG